MKSTDFIRKDIKDMSKEELEEYILETVSEIKNDFSEARSKALNEQNRVRNKIVAC